MVARRRARQLHEARQSGNIDLDIDADWLDYEAAGVGDREALSRRITEVLAAARLGGGRLQPWLRWRLDPEANRGSSRSSSWKRARRSPAVWPRTRSPNSSRPTTSTDSISMPRSQRTLLFGTPIGPAFDFEALADNVHVMQVLEKVG